ncbi:MAG: hypothetical protein LBH47_02305 [Christensenellaceae bacterium]|jgi:hypothetical protein|nr:hypothetical protein [Christensenellaceae bacterium]
MKVFIGGSIKINSLDEMVEEKLESYIENGDTILIGDAGGADSAVQKYLFEKGYRNVVVYSSDLSVRSNIGNWNVNKITGLTGGKHGRNLHAVKDIALAFDCDLGFMIWNGQSKGTMNNITNLIDKNKDVIIFLNNERKFISQNEIKSAKQLSFF